MFLLQKLITKHLNKFNILLGKFWGIKKYCIPITYNTENFANDELNINKAKNLLTFSLWRIFDARKSRTKLWPSKFFFLCALIWSDILFSPLLDFQIREGCLLHQSTKIYNNVFLLFGLTTFETSIEFWLVGS